MAKTPRPALTVTCRSIVLTCLLMACYLPAYALNPALNVSQYAHTSWKIRDGFSKGTITSIAQTPDGYLWLGTEFGLLRFDGVRAVPWQPPADQRLPSDVVISLLVARDGTLWIGTWKGLASWKDGKLTQYADLAGTFVSRLLEDHEGTVWVGGSASRVPKLCAVRNGSVQRTEPVGSMGISVTRLYEDRKGNLWVGVRNGVWRWKPGPPMFYPLTDEPNGISGIGEDDDGALLIGMDGGIQRLVDGQTELYRLTDKVAKFQTRQLLHDRDGGLWIGTLGFGLVHVHKGRMDLFGQPDGLSSEDILGLFEDREGNIWVSTNGGLDRFRDVTVATFSMKQGLLGTIVGSVLAAGDGNVWLATFGGLNQWNQGQVTVPLTGSGKPDGKLNGEHPQSLFQDARGRIWTSIFSGVGYLENSRFVPIRGLPGGNASGIAEDAVGNMWITSQEHGLLRLSPRSEVRQIPWVELGHTDAATAFVVDPGQGGLWLGFLLGGITYFREGQVNKTYAAADGLGEGRVGDLRIERNGTLWAATEGGLSRVRNGRVSTLSSKNGLPCDAVHSTIEDDNHSLWLTMPCGLVRVALAEVDAWAEAVDRDGVESDTVTKRMIHATVFDISDGVRTNAVAGGYHPQITKSTDGKLWFAGVDGVNVVDPQHLPINKLPPPVHIEQIIADRKTYDTTSDSVGALRLPALSRDLQIDYTALSLVAPEKIRFRYKLEGYDRDWQDAGDRRQAFYTNLPPRNYRFRVIACNNSGVWNETGTFLDFTISPAYYQTLWFRALFVIAVLLVLFALYRLRVRQVAQHVRAGMEGRLDERERIARDLHDTLLQSVQGLILKVHAAAKQITVDAAARAALEKTLDHADQVLAEGRDRVRNLRATAVSIEDLAAAFKSVVAESPQGRQARFRTVVEGNVRQLHPLVQEESYCIGREAIVNALTHSGGRNVEVEIIYESQQFRLRVRDDGHGIEQKILEEGGRSDHWGMQGMRERAEKIGAQLKLWSGHDTGTEVELTVPGTTAYPGAGESNFSWSALYKKLVKQ